MSTSAPRSIHGCTPSCFSSMAHARRSCSQTLLPKRNKLADTTNSYLRFMIVREQYSQLIAYFPAGWALHIPMGIQLQAIDAIIPAGQGNPSNVILPACMQLQDKQETHALCFTEASPAYQKLAQYATRHLNLLTMQSANYDTGMLYRRAGCKDNRAL